MITREGTMVLRVRQVVGVSNDGGDKAERVGVVVSSGFDSGTTLGRNNIKNYNFFSYEVYEALHLSEQERQIVIDCLKNIELELSRGSINTAGC